MKRDSPMPDSDLLQVADAIRQYLAKHPDAADTLEGVANWWLVRQRYENTVNMVGRALELLVERGELTKIKHRGSPPIYKIRRRG